MLPQACRWIDGDDASHLYYNYGCIGIVRGCAAGWTTVINWREKTHSAPAGSRQQGKRWIERWVSAQRGLPKAPRPLRKAERLR